MCAVWEAEPPTAHRWRCRAPLAAAAGAVPPRRNGVVRWRRATLERSTRLSVPCGVSVSVMLVRSGVDNPFRDARTTLEPRLSTSITAYGAYGYRSFYVTRTRVADRAPHRAAAPTTHRDPRIVSLSALGAPPQAQHGPWMPVATMVAASLLSLKSRPQPVSHEHMHIHIRRQHTEAPHHSHPSHSLKRDVQQHDFGDRAPTPGLLPHAAAPCLLSIQHNRVQTGGGIMPPSIHAHPFTLALTILTKALACPRGCQ